MGDLETALIKRALANGGAITRSEVLALGMSDTTLRRRVADGWLVRKNPGVYMLPWTADVGRSLLAAATTKLAAAVSHEAAARLHEMRGLSSDRLVVSVPVRRTNRFEGVRVHQSTDLTSDQLTMITGLRVTTAARTIIDLAAVLRRPRLERVLSFAIADNLTDLDDLARLFDRLARRGKPGTRNLRRTLESLNGGSIPAASELELRFLTLIRLAGLPEPATQFDAPWLRKVSGRVDFAYPDQRLVIEVDGRRWHSEPAAFLKDRERDNLAQLAGWRVLRFTWHHITKEQSYVVSTVAEALTATF